MNKLKLFLITAIAFAFMAANGAAYINMATNTSVTPINFTNTSTAQFTVTFWPIVSNNSDSIGNVSNGSAFVNCSLWTNVSGTFLTYKANTSAIVNNTVNSIQVNASILDVRNLIWAVQCYDNTTPANWSSAGNWTKNMTLHIDTKAPRIGNGTVGDIRLQKNITDWYNYTVSNWVNWSSVASNMSFNMTVLVNDSLNVSAEGNASTGVVEVNMSVEQNGSQVNWTQAYLANGAQNIGGPTWGNWTAVMNFSKNAGFEDGLWNITVRMRDYAGNTNYTNAFLTVVINNSYPNITATTGGGTVTNVLTKNITLTVNETMQLCRYAYNGTYDYATMASNFSYGNYSKFFHTTFTGAYGSTYNIAVACLDWANTEARSNISALLFSYTVAPDIPPVTSGGTGGTTEKVSAIASIPADGAGTFTMNKYDIQTVSIEATEAAANVKVTVQSLGTSAPATVTEAPTGVVYKYYEISKENIDDANIKKGIIAFQVEKAWFTDNQYDAATTKLVRWANGTWTALATTQTGSNDTYYTFSAETPGFSTFAVKAEALAQEICNITCPDGKTLNTETCTCVTTTPTCGADETLDTATNTCKKTSTALIAGLPDYMTYIILAVVAAAVLGGIYFYTSKTKKFPIKGK